MACCFLCPQWIEWRRNLAKFSSRKISVRDIGSHLIVSMVRHGKAHLLVRLICWRTRKNIQQCTICLSPFCIRAEGYNKWCHMILCQPTFLWLGGQDEPEDCLTRALILQERKSESQVGWSAKSSILDWWGHRFCRLLPCTFHVVSWCKKPIVDGCKQQPLQMYMSPPRVCSFEGLENTTEMQKRLYLLIVRQTSEWWETNHHLLLQDSNDPSDSCCLQASLCGSQAQREIYPLC